MRVSREENAIQSLTTECLLPVYVMHTFCMMRLSQHGSRAIIPRHHCAPLRTDIFVSGFNGNTSSIYNGNECKDKGLSWYP